jgi:hypothetical protein
MDENAGEYEKFHAHWIERGATVKLRKQLSWGGKFDTGLAVPPEQRGVVHAPALPDVE